MIIDGNNYTINVLVLCMEAEIDVTVQTIENLLPSLEEDVTVSLLINGGGSDRLRDLFAAFPTLKLYESETNLGVAGGRNLLLRKDECRAADIVLILDNDVITPVDYVRTLASFLVRTPKAGVVGGVATNVNNAIRYETLRFYGEPGAFGGRTFRITSADIKESLAKKITPNHLYHIGTHPNYFYTYFSIRPAFWALAGKLLQRLRIKVNHQTSLVKNDRYLGYLKSGVDKYEVTNVAGCSQAFWRALVDELGYLDDRLNPYGWEDVDFCIRARQAGYKNYIDTNTWLYHGTDTRHQQRNPLQKAKSLMRGRTIMASTVVGRRRYKRIALKLVFGMFLFELPRFGRRALRRLKAQYGGFKLGVAVVEGLDQQVKAPLRFNVADRGLALTKNERRLRDLKNAYAGRRAFIIGGGPSIKNTDLSPLKDEITIGCNGIFLISDEMGFLPTFYTVEDTLLAEDRAERINEISGTSKIFPHDLRYCLRPDSYTTFMNFVRPGYPDFPRFSTDFAHHVFWGGTVTFLNMQLAYYLGITELFLTGIDHSYQPPSPADEQENFTIHAKTPDPNHFHPDYFGPGYRYHDPQVERMEQGYVEAKRVFEENRRVIYNATVGGKLEVFQRVDYLSLFESEQIKKVDDKSQRL